MTVSPKRTMLPPIWVAACDSQRRRNRRCGRPRAGLPPPARGSSPRPSRGRAVGRGRDGGGHGRVAARHERRRAGARARAARGGRGGRTSGSAGRCRRRAGRPATCRRRTDAARRSRTTSPSRSVRTGWSVIGRSGYQRRGCPWAGTSERVVAGELEAVDRGDRDLDVGLGRRELGDEPPDRVSEPVSLSGAPIAVELERDRRGACRRPRPHPARRPRRRRSRPGRRPTAIASAPALRSSLMRSSTPGPSIGPLIEIVTPGPATGSSPA